MHINPSESISSPITKLVTSVASFIARSCSQQPKDSPKFPATNEEMQMNNGPAELQNRKEPFLQLAVQVSKQSSKPTLNKFR
jgi:hypothetical protein